MATPTAIRSGLAAALETIPKLVVVRNLAEVTTLADGGGAVIGGPIADYTGAMGRGLVTWNYPIYMLVPTSNYDAATELLDEFVAASGDRSIPGLLWDKGRETAGGLGILDSNGKPDVDAHINELTAYGITFDVVGIPHLAAVLNCVVHTPGKPT